MTFVTIPLHTPAPPGQQCEWLKEGHCYWCCDRCNYGDHRTPCCGEDVDHNGNERSGKPHDYKKCVE